MVYLELLCEIEKLKLGAWKRRCIIEKAGFGILGKREADVSKIELRLAIFLHFFPSFHTLELL